MLFFLNIFLIWSTVSKENKSSIQNYHVIERAALRFLKDQLVMVESFTCVKFILRIEPEYTFKDGDTMWVSVNVIIENQHFVIENQIIAVENGTIRLIVKKDAYDAITNNPFYISFVLKEQNQSQLKHSNLIRLKCSKCDDKNEENNFKLDATYIYIKNYLGFILNTFKPKILEKSQSDLKHPLIITYDFKKNFQKENEDEKIIFLYFLAGLMHQQKTGKKDLKINVDYKVNPNTIVVDDSQDLKTVYSYEAVIDYLDKNRDILGKKLYEEITYLYRIKVNQTHKWLENSTFEIQDIQQEDSGSKTVEIVKFKKSLTLSYNNLFCKLTKGKVEKPNLSTDEESLKFILN